MTNAGDRLNERVWRLFARAGFYTHPCEGDPREEEIVLSTKPKRKRKVDISAQVPSLGVKIIGENTISPDLRGSFTTRVHDLEKLMPPAKAQAGLLVLPRYEVTTEDREYAKGRNIQVWDKDTLGYYEAIVETIGTWARYEIIHSFGIQTAEERNTHTVLGIKLRQHPSASAPEVFMFCVTPEFLLKTCVLYRRAQGNADAYQRMLNKRRLASVRKFVAQENALLPTNIIVHFGDSVTCDVLPTPTHDAQSRRVSLARPSAYELVRLNIPMQYASLELIDGQHRLYGFTEADAATRQSFNLVVVGLRDLPKERRRDTFVAINDNSRRMNPNLVCFLKHTEDEKQCGEYPELMAIRVVVLLSQTSPFRNRIQLLDVGTQRITLKGFSGYDLRGFFGDRGLLRKHYDHNSEIYAKVLRMYFSVLKSLFPIQWRHPDQYVIFSNRGVSAFLKLLKSILRTVGGKLDAKVIKEYLEPLRTWSDSHWENTKLKKAYVGSQGWKQFHRDLVRQIRRTYSGFKE